MDAWLLLALLFAIGASLGSFLNVVVYRLPRGESLVHPASRCPVCAKPIRWRDNLPVVGWLLLWGRCRDCRAAISPRYPAVELFMGVLAVLIGWANMGWESGVAGEGAASLYFDAGSYLLQLLLAGTLVAAALVEFDGFALPIRALAVMLVAIIVVGFFVPVENSRTIGQAAEGTTLVARLSGLGGGVVLAALGWPAWIGRAGDWHVARAIAAALLMVLVSTALGARGAAEILVVSLVALILLALAARVYPAVRCLGWAAALASITIAWLVAGLAEIFSMPWFGNSPVEDWTARAAVVAVLAIAARIAGAHRLGWERA